MTSTRPLRLRYLHSWLPAVLIAVGLLAGLTACSSRQPPFALKSISGLMPALKFQMIDQDGAPVTAANYRGKIVMLYFGYTHCPDVCPTTLAMLARVVHALSPTDAAQVRVLFVSVDPARDTSAVLKRYLGYFDSRFVGLHNDDDALTALTKRYRLAYHREPPDRDGNYAVDHSSAIFIFDRNGKARLLAGETDSPANIEEDLRRLIAGS